MSSFICSLQRNWQVRAASSSTTTYEQRGREARLRKATARQLRVCEHLAFQLFQLTIGRGHIELGPVKERPPRVGNRQRKQQQDTAHAPTDRHVLRRALLLARFGAARVCRSSNGHPLEQDAVAVGGGGGHLDQPGGQDGARAAVAMERWHCECRHERER
eukprot:scaffold53025_cov60-Phaeocystis_antarctica.AAC.5